MLLCIVMWYICCLGGTRKSDHEQKAQFHSITLYQRRRVRLWPTSCKNVCKEITISLMFFSLPLHPHDVHILSWLSENVIPRHKVQLHSIPLYDQRRVRLTR